MRRHQNTPLRAPLAHKEPPKPFFRRFFAGFSPVFRLFRTRRHILALSKHHHSRSF
jgi:hypothetical protein